MVVTAPGPDQPQSEIAHQSYTNNPGSVLQENPEKARVTINNWISNKTENLIQDTLPKGALDSNTILVLVNTIYFKVHTCTCHRGSDRGWCSGHL